MQGAECAYCTPICNLSPCEGTACMPLQQGWEIIFLPGAECVYFEMTAHQQILAKNNLLYTIRY
jgi:hypothetical protein